MIRRKLALLGTTVAISLLLTVPAFAADTKDSDTAQNAQNTQSIQEEKAEEKTEPLLISGQASILSQNFYQIIWNIL